MFCAALPVLAPPADAREHRYTVRLDAALERLQVEARFDGAIGRLEARSRRADDFLVDARPCDSAVRLQPRGRRLALPAGASDCLRYTVDLAAAVDSARGAWRLSEQAVVAGPAYWLWHPRLDAGDRLAVSFELPPSMQVAIPWGRAGGDGTFELGPSPESGRALAVFGRFQNRVTRLGDTEIRVSVLGDVDDRRAAEFTAWIRATAVNVAQAYGRLPNRDVSVFLIPSGDRGWNSNTAVPFGRVVRDGGESIELWINPERPLAEFYAEWTPTHEFAHLMLPYLEREQRWISEGFASYYQNVLLARAGQYSEAEAWERLSAGFARGRNSVPSLSPNAAAATAERNTRMKVYWSGAAIALIADIELRRRSNSSESLDTLLEEFAACCLPSEHSWTGPELFATLDGFLDRPLFMPLYHSWANRPGFPEVDALLRELGVDPSQQDRRLADDAPLASVRRALMAGSGR